ncbi:MAG: hypothetical protein MUF00_02100 [Gemmatimonadaceae bacterium]|jgi:ankyrin repeat protein|nr:hypothetical protein [Gemmatimonadaceae bacterium]
MSTLTQPLLDAFETHSVAGVAAALDAGLDVTQPIEGKQPVDHLIEMYYRSDAFPACLTLVLARGARIEDALLRMVLLDDIDGLRALSVPAQEIIAHRVSLPCAFTPLDGATLLHVAAEYGHVAMTRHLLALGADVDARAAVDPHGMNGHTPLFHTVNSNGNRSLPVMRVLLEAGARTDVLLPGITWGAGFDWATTCFDVTPVSYAQLGLLRQMQRTEADTYHTTRLLLAAAGRSVPTELNVPNRYLRS